MLDGTNDPINLGQIVDPVEPVGPVQDGDMQSVIASLREHRNQLGANSAPLELEVPGYDGLLLIRYRWVSLKDLSKNTENLQRIKESNEQNVAAAADTLIGTCDEFLVRVGDELQPLSDNGVPITFGDTRLVGLLGFDTPKTVRDAVRSVFGNEYALIKTASVIIEWLQDTSLKVDQGFLAA